jgi:hypothetical protein
MTAKHGTRRRYVEGCRCADCTEANRLYFRQRRAGESPAVVVSPPQEPSGPGPVESAVVIELATLPAATDRPGLAQMALALARILDNPKAVSSQPPAARMLTTLLERLRLSSARAHRGRLAVVRAMSANDETPTPSLGPSGARER